MLISRSVNIPWMPLVLLCFGFLLTRQDLHHAYDDMFPGLPWIEIELSFAGTGPDGRPMIDYGINAYRAFGATWVATIEDADGNRIVTRRGPGNYSPFRDGGEPWEWDAFFDVPFRIVPVVPDQPFRVCVRYDNMVASSGSEQDTSDTFCSEIYEPDV